MLTVNSNHSPHITHLSWGHITIKNDLKFKDAKLYPGGAKEWDWTETGTHHSPGIQPVDVAELTENGADVIVLSRGMLKRLKVCPGTLEHLEKKNITTHILPTKEAVILYNELRMNHPVGGLFHSTC